MAAPVVVRVVKVSLAAVSDERVRTAVAAVVVGILMPFFLTVILILCALSATAEHNHAAVDLTFHGGYLSASLPAEYRTYIETMQESLAELDGIVAEINGMAEDGSVDAYSVKSVFYSLFFGEEQPRMDTEDYQRFADCFVTYEEREDEDGETYTVAISLADYEVIYGNIGEAFHLEVTQEDRTNIWRVYALARYGTEDPIGNGMEPGEAMGDGSFAALFAEATRYIGYAYVWGGSSPDTGFDCSGYVCWVYTQSGVYDLARTSAQGIFDQCAVVEKEELQPGDLVFFTGTYASGTPVSHVGIYVGGSQMLHCGDPIGYASIDSAYWSSHYYAGGRLPN
ncbi:MAG: C40 family peptidase [Lachnospiraceae bacterium]|nr:C40 family peptidase [Lachnospiraceae bacterium]